MNKATITIIKIGLNRIKPRKDIKRSRILLKKFLYKRY